MTLRPLNPIFRRDAKDQARVERAKALHRSLKGRAPNVWKRNPKARRGVVNGQQTNSSTVPPPPPPSKSQATETKLKYKRTKRDCV